MEYGVKRHFFDNIYFQHIFKLTVALTGIGTAAFGVALRKNNCLHGWVPKPG